MASLVAETAARLIATTGEGEEVDNKRRLGQALFGCEVLGFHRRSESHAWGTQGLIVELGVYDDDDLAIILEDRSKHDRRERSVLGVELSKSLGGYKSAAAVDAQKIDVGDENWLLARYENPRATISHRLDRVVTKDVHDLTVGELQILTRHTRYRISVDHAHVKGSNEGNESVRLDEVRDVLFWWTPIVDEWLQGRSLRGYLDSVAAYVVGQGTSTDDVTASFDDWGDIDITADPLNVMILGPAISQSTEADMRHVLRRAGKLLNVKNERCRPGFEWNTYEPQINAMEELLERYQTLPDSERNDVLVMYRGGGIEYKKSVRDLDADRARLLDLAVGFTELGVEVVFGLGHADETAVPEDCDLPIGVYEATTPTAAAEWVIREFVNSRMANSAYDPGQRST